MQLFQVEWQSEQEKKESKSLYQSGKEASYMPTLPKITEVSSRSEKPQKDAETGDVKSQTDSKDDSKSS